MVATAEQALPGLRLGAVDWLIGDEYDGHPRPRPAGLRFTLLHEEPLKMRTAAGSASFPPVPFEPALKVPAVESVVGDRPAAWIDDNHTIAGQQWAAERPAPTLLVSIDPAVGWTRSDVDRVLDWVKHLRSHRPPDSRPTSS